YDGRVFLAKNSDREANEMQALEYHPAATHGPGERLRCTYIDIEQAPRTHAILISQPFWMWGAEMGVNEKGVAIGNEAIWTKMPIHKKNDRLLGMDLLRLALERGNTARESLDVICGLLERYGQGGIAGYRDKNMAYHNSFLIADKTEAWVLETADHLWVAKKVQRYYSISNGATIGEEYDLAHPALIDTARKKGWLKKGENFSFRKSYSDWFYTTFSASKTRRHLTSCYLQEQGGKIDVQSAINTLQSHHKPDYASDDHLLGCSVCAHAGYPLTRRATQTTGSMVAHLTENPAAWFTATSAACTSVFKPVWFSGAVLPGLGTPGPVFDENNYWWKHEKLHRLVIRNYKKSKLLFSRELAALQAEFLAEARQVPETQKFDLTKKSFQKSASKTEEWMNALKSRKFKPAGNPLYRWYWRKLNNEARMGI
ncbi:MAG: C69 family dipeptidase, partial [Saprospiraceae bacterium]